MPGLRQRIRLRLAADAHRRSLHSERARGWCGLTGSKSKLSWHATGTDAAKSGDLGYSTGKYELSYTDPSGKTVSDHGKYVTVWQKQADGSWKVVRDIFNSDGSPGQ